MPLYNPMTPSFLTTSMPNEINPLDAFCCVCRWTLNAKNHGYAKNVDNTKNIHSLHKMKFSIKVELSPFKKSCVICLIERPLKMMENAFYFFLKALFVHKIFNFLSPFFDM